LEMTITNVSQLDKPYVSIPILIFALNPITVFKNPIVGYNIADRTEGPTGRDFLLCCHLNRQLQSM